MRSLVSLLSSFLFLSSLSFSSVDGAPVLHQSRSVLPHGWSRVAPAKSTNARLELQFFVKPAQPELLTSLLSLVSDPTSPQYGHYYTHDQIQALSAPRKESVDAVLSWLHSHGFSQDEITNTPNFDIISILAPVEKAEEMLNTEYHHYLHGETKRSAVRAEKYYLPEEIAQHIDVVGPTTRFPSVHKGPQPSKKKVKLVENFGSPEKPAATCDSTDPTCLRTAYNIGSYQANSNTSLALNGFLEQYISLSDLSSFYSQYDHESPSTRVPIIVGPNDQTQPGIEASLDIQYGSAVAANVTSTFWYVAGRQPHNDQNEPFLVWLQQLASTAQVPWVISTSYGDNEPTVDFDYATRVNLEFVKAGLRGISLLFSSGDGGVSGGQQQQCTSFVATYPAASPYVTAVGGTSGYPESAASLSSGGFSNYWARPSYQKQAVSDYLTKYGQNIPDSSLFNGTSRAFPDVAAFATNFPVVVSGWTEPVDGTSCASPTFAGVVALLNDVRFKLGKSSLGFLNPLIYQHPEVFNDITSGSNPGCNTNGFQASQAWDPVTGLGSPDFKKFSKLVASLP